MEFLTEEDIKWKGTEYYEQQKIILNDSKYAIPWRDIYSKRSVSGPCMKTCSKLKPINVEDFYNRAGDICNKLSKDNMERIAVMWRNYCKEDNIPLSTFYDVVVCHNIIETFNGKLQEINVANMLREHGFEIIPNTDKDDAERGIDIIAKKNNKLHFIQVKVISYLYGIKPDLVNDRKKVFDEYIPNQIKEYGEGIPYVWIFYDYKTKEWIWNENNNSFQWDITKLLDATDQFCSLKTEYRDYFKSPQYRRKTLGN